ncbi:hypothetical protein D9619_009002 [Psilocybe cf. subviscida]|uniref:NAD(P)-binding protein n=1 Tax=Psilocybe cf. subviscida TaxID=2480587 RepID=A0A8H5FAB1_9AGAR|nr:hypothetical protein D9619_009002 [Psilocybe cf. subviscida]
MPIAASHKVWFVTGASSGLGKAVVEYALCQGDKVSATCRKPSVLAELQSKWPSSQLIVLKLDVTSPTDITAAFEKAVDTFGRIDVVYNNAKHRVTSGENGTQDNEARRLFDVDFWGAVDVSREAVKVFREINEPVGGLLLQISSMIGVLSPPGAPFYCARFVTNSQFALEGYLGVLSKETRRSWNIRVKVLDFGAFATPVAESLIEVPIKPVYEALSEDSPTKRLHAWIDNSRPMVGDIAKAAGEVYNISRDEHLDAHRIPLRLDALDTAEVNFEGIKTAQEETALHSQDSKMVA